MTDVGAKRIPCGMRLRPVTCDDHSALYAIYYAAVHHAPGAFYDSAQRSAWAPERGMPSWFTERLSASLALLAEDEDGPAAFMALTTDGCLDFAYAHPRVMGQGVGDALHGEIVARARAMGLSRLHAEASHYARRFLFRHGWTVTRAFKKRKNGAVFDQVEMELRLAPRSEG